MPYIEAAEDIFRQSPKSVDDFILQVSQTINGLKSANGGFLRAIMF